MLIGKPNDVPASEITPYEVYVNRRKFMRQAGLTALAASLAPGLLTGFRRPQQTPITNYKNARSERGEKLTSYEDITHYNNFYEFGTGKEDPSRNAQQFRTRPWSVTVEGHVAKPGTMDLDTFLKPFTVQDRIYRLRCVEAWSMVIPWQGFPLADVIERVQPTSRAKFVEFVTLYDPEQMPGQRRGVLDWPYVEGLRMDEAMHPLTILATGLYGRPLPNQDGAPLRLVVPWKYGFKSIKSIVKIRFVEKMPETTWHKSAPDEYGFYSNVNPHVDHPRWSQARERRIGEFRRRPTLMFNGYGDQVANLYAGMDLRKWF
jgi:methionine sulfoxide reductase catalytic subunit